MEATTQSLESPWIYKNHQKTTITVAESPQMLGTGVCKVTTQDGVSHENVRFDVVESASVSPRNPYAVTYYPDENRVIFGPYGLPGGMFRVERGELDHTQSGDATIRYGDYATGTTERGIFLKGKLHGNGTRTIYVSEGAWEEVTMLERDQKQFGSGKWVDGVPTGVFLVSSYSPEKGLERLIVTFDSLGNRIKVQAAPPKAPRESRRPIIGELQAYSSQSVSPSAPPPAAASAPPFDQAAYMADLRSKYHGSQSAQ